MTISEELKTQVISQVQMSLERFFKAYGIEMPMPTIKYETSQTLSHAGEAFVDSNLIKFNPWYLMKYKGQFIARTVIHELAHLAVEMLKKMKLVAKNVHDHGPVFKKMMLTLGATEENTSIGHPYNFLQSIPATVRGFFVFKCGDCTKGYRCTPDRMQMNKQFKCACGGALHNAEV